MSFGAIGGSGGGGGGGGTFEEILDNDDNPAILSTVDGAPFTVGVWGFGSSGDGPKWSDGIADPRSGVGFQSPLGSLRNVAGVGLLEKVGSGANDWELYSAGWRKVDLQTAASAASSLSANLGVAGALKYRIHWRARSTANAVSATAGLRINSSSASDYTTAGAALTTSGYFGLMAGSQTNSDRWGAGALEITPGPVAANAWSLIQGLESRVNSTATITSSNSPILGAWRDSVGAGMSTIQMIPSAGNLDVGSFMYVEVLP